MSVERIPEEVLERAARRLCRRIASVLVRCMAESDMNFADIGQRLNKSESSVRRWMNSLIDGTAKELRIMSDMAVAMGVEIEFSVTPLEELSPRPADAPEAQSDTGNPVTEQHQEVTEAA